MPLLLLKKVCTQILYIPYILLAILIQNSSSYNTKIAEDQVWSEYALFTPNNDEVMTQPTLINLYPNEYSLKLRY